MSHAVRWRALAVVAVLAGAAALVASRPARLGLDLEGGTQIVLEAQDTERQKVFLAALLSVIGYSINDSVVIFDRIREQRRARAREPLAAVANDACLQTIPRTVNTGLGALFILAALYVLGGETLTDFAPGPAGRHPGRHLLVGLHGRSPGRGSAGAGLPRGKNRPRRTAQAGRRSPGAGSGGATPRPCPQQRPALGRRQLGRRGSRPEPARRPTSAGGPPSSKRQHRPGPGHRSGRARDGGEETLAQLGFPGPVPCPRIPSRQPVKSHRGEQS